MVQKTRVRLPPTEKSHKPPRHLDRMDASRLEESVERWLIHSDHKFSRIDTPHNFAYSIEYEYAPGDSLVIFHPKQKRVALVIGSAVLLSNFQNYRYLSLSDAEKKSMTDRIKEYCKSIGAISKSASENGKLVTWVYTVVDDEELFNQQGLMDAMAATAEMGEDLRGFLHRIF